LTEGEWGVAWVIGARGGLQFCRPQKSWGYEAPSSSPFCRPLLTAARGGKRFPRVWLGHWVTYSFIQSYTHYSESSVVMLIYA